MRKQKYSTIPPMGLHWIIGFLLTLPARVLAQTPSLFPDGGIISGFGFISGGDIDCDFNTGVIDAECIPVFIAHIIKFIFGFTGAFFLLMIIWSGYQIALGGVTQDKEKGKNRLIFAIVGFIICTLTFFIIDFIVSTVAGL